MRGIVFEVLRRALPGNLFERPEERPLSDAEVRTALTSIGAGDTKSKAILEQALDMSASMSVQATSPGRSTSDREWYSGGAWALLTLVENVIRAREGNHSSDAPRAGPPR